MYICSYVHIHIHIYIYIHIHIHIHRPGEGSLLFVLPFARIIVGSIISHRTAAKAQRAEPHSN